MKFIVKDRNKSIRIKKSENEKQETDRSNLHPKPRDTQTQKRKNETERQRETHKTYLPSLTIFINPHHRVKGVGIVELERLEKV